MNLDKIFNFRLIISLILIILLFYSGYWIVVSNILKKTISDELNKNDFINYNDLSISGFPTQVQVNVHEFKILDSINTNEILGSELIKISMHPFDTSKIALKSEHYPKQGKVTTDLAQAKYDLEQRQWNANYYNGGY